MSDELRWVMSELFARLMDGQRELAHVCRWADEQHVTAWWAYLTEGAADYAGMYSGPEEACRAAALAVGVWIEPPADLVAEWAGDVATMAAPEERAAIDAGDRPLSDTVTAMLYAFQEGFSERLFSLADDRGLVPLHKIYPLIEEALDTGARSQRGDYGQ